MSDSIQRQEGQKQEITEHTETKGEQGRQEGIRERKPWTKSETILLILIVLGVVAVVVKYFVLR